MSPVEEPLERRAIISGIGQSDIGRRLGRSDLDLTVDACLAAIADAGLTRDDIDGLSTYPAMGAGPPGFGGPSSPEVQDALGLSLNWHDGGGEGPAQMRAVHAAALAVAAGLAKHVLVYRTVTEGSAQGTGGRQGMGGTVAAEGARSPLRRLPPVVNPLRCRLGRQLAGHGGPAPHARVRSDPRAAGRHRGQQPGQRRPEPQGDLPRPDVDGGLSRGAHDHHTAVPLRLRCTLRRVDRGDRVAPGLAPDLDHPAVHINALGTALRGRPSWDQFDDMTTMAARDAGASLWERTELMPADVDTAQLYDGFSILTVVWLEATGFCGRGESGPFLEGGANIARDGLLPLNTAGGQLSGGRLHGFGLIHEACVQLRGEGGERQVVRPGGRDVEVAAVANGGGPIAGAMLLTRGVR